MVVTRSVLIFEPRVFDTLGKLNYTAQEYAEKNVSTKEN